MQTIQIKDKSQLVASSGSIDTYNYPTWHESARIVVNIDFGPAMDGGQPIVTHWFGIVDSNNTLKNIDGSDGDLEHTVEIEDCEIEITPSYLQERLSDFGNPT
jgi:hypothetical protein